ncbi:MAG: alpha/beta fold hydrolase [Candidatus Krumholzibacteria bacterium]|jgi:pimeloyl-ACP methyl ester carboxylesterase|nr:alpha/beta fold hydrolase [Candidatus Krumholzibacteria bacterium]MDP6796361.1 alpha/beta fold hydrolase [Candidatus Krumholzibacteria bacterium]MDP7021979.1 alpha/beta fold hydrolase [Candidatus Krumholzibacteria bacterium]
MSHTIPFEFPSPADGAPLRGDLHLPQGEPAASVLLVHGFKGFKDWGFWPPFAEMLAERGLAACRFNLSGSGVGPDGETFSEKDRFEANTNSRELADILFLLDLLSLGKVPGAPTKPGPVGLVGHSRGGGGAILAAASEPRVASLVTWASVASVQRYTEEQKQKWRERGHLTIKNARTGDAFRIRTAALDDIEEHEAALDILSAAASLDIPSLVIHGMKDEAVPFAEGLALAQAFQRKGRFLPLPDSGHTFSASHPMPQDMPDDLARVFEASAKHLEEVLL